ncbi:dihydropteroate synthase [Desulfobulbus alkaliphilus]|uniref:dihydropteroate synthase n=1 Tax=Desulfobulbus alkaliphilus TaxID=869814 RepID=UPI001962A3DE|nr:dihydropteroate synthase [Desulfobulbus alkaliphilus]MBM9536956.1 dihydropteroate synthase [Desulfobulbus alkaliphilus]
MRHAVHIMGILNVTPDSFSDGGSWTSQAALMDRIDTLLREGVEYIDVGGESTRPFARPVSVEEELRRVLPAIRAIRARSSSLPISIDTTKARVAAEALAAGATIVNDISALRHDPDMIRVVAGYVGPVIIMHMQGNPATMQVQPSYRDVVVEINGFFTERIARLEEQGIDRGRIIIDPGIGFGKTLEHNLTILRNIPAFKHHGCPVLIGHSRKSFFGQLFDLPVQERDWPTAVVSAFCARQGVDILRVHDIRVNRMALTMEHLLREDH